MNYNYFKNKIEDLKNKESLIVYDSNSNFGFGVKKDINSYIIGEIRLPENYYFCKVNFFFIDNTVECCKNIDDMMKQLFTSIFSNIYLFNWFKFKNEKDKLKYERYLKDYNNSCMKIEDPYLITIEEEKQLKFKYMKMLNYIYSLFIDNLVDIMNIGCAIIENEQK